MDDLDFRLEILITLSALGALSGALITPLVYWAKGRKPASGFFAGVFAGALGNLIFLIPLWIFLKRRTVQSIPFSITSAYNLGTAAALGGRLEEARYYFIQVTQADPAHVGAWLYLANLATSPLEAWSYVQQARNINPSDPIVQEAVSVVWPQVQHLYGERRDMTPVMPPNPE